MIRCLNLANTFNIEIVRSFPLGVTGAKRLLTEYKGRRLKACSTFPEQSSVFGNKTSSPLHIEQSPWKRRKFIINHEVRLSSSLRDCDISSRLSSQIARSQRRLRAMRRAYSTLHLSNPSITTSTNIANRYQPIGQVERLSIPSDCIETSTNESQLPADSVQCRIISSTACQTDDAVFENVCVIPIPKDCIWDMEEL